MRYWPWIPVVHSLIRVCPRTRIVGHQEEDDFYARSAPGSSPGTGHAQSKPFVAFEVAQFRAMPTRSPPIRRAINSPGGSQVMARSVAVQRRASQADHRLHGFLRSVGAQAFANDAG